VRSLVVVVAVLVCPFGVKYAACDVATFELSSMEVVGDIGGSGLVLIHLPTEDLDQLGGEIHEALLDFTIGWANAGTIIVGYPFRSGVDTIPASGWPAGGDDLRFASRSGLIRTLSGTGRCTLNVAKLLTARRQGVLSADAVLLMLSQGEAPVRWPSAAMASFEGEDWTARLKVYLEPAE